VKKLIEWFVELKGGIEMEDVVTFLTAGFEGYREGLKIMQAAYYATMRCQASAVEEETGIPADTIRVVHLSTANNS